MVRGCGEDQEEIHILENGRMEKLMDMAFILGSMVINIKVSLDNH